MTEKRYKIRTVSDLYKIPASKLEYCLQDVRLAIESHKVIAKLSMTKCDDLDEIEWIDDGKHDVHVTIMGKVVKANRDQ